MPIHKTTKSRPNPESFDHMFIICSMCKRMEKIEQKAFLNTGKTKFRSKVVLNKKDQQLVNYFT